MSLLPSLVCCAALQLAPAASQDVGLTGLWTRNAEKSDDPRAAMRDAMERVQEPRSGRRGGFGRRSPGSGMPPSGGGPRGSGRPGGTPDLGVAAEQLELELVDGELHVDDGEKLRIYYLDGEEHRRETANGTKLETVAELKGNAVLIEETMERGRVTRKLELSPDGEILVATVSLKLGRMPDPVVIRTVYQRAVRTSSD
jgi:hypothetical protein